MRKWLKRGKYLLDTEYFLSHAKQDWFKVTFKTGNTLYLQAKDFTEVLGHLEDNGAKQFTISKIERR